VTEEEMEANCSLFPIGESAFKLYRITGNSQFDIYAGIPQGAGIGKLRNALALGKFKVLVIVVNSVEGSIFKLGLAYHSDVKDRLLADNMPTKSISFWVNMLLFGRNRELLYKLRHLFMRFDQFGAVHENFGVRLFPGGRIKEYDEILSRGVQMNVGKLLLLR